MTVSTLRLSAQIAAGSLLMAAALRAAAAPTQSPDKSEQQRRAVAVASYDGGAVTIGEIEDTIADSSPLSQAHALEPDALREVLDRNLRFELLAQEAERRGYRHDPRVQKAAKQSAVELMIFREVNAPLKADPATPEALRAYFDSHRALFSLRELRRASAIVLRSEAEARELLPAFKAAGDQALRALVRERGLPVPSRDSGGDLRPFDASGAPESGDVPVEPALAKAAFALAKVGDTSGIIHVGAGYAIVKLTEVRPGYTPSFDEVKVRVRRRFDDERYEKGVEALSRAQRERLHPAPRYELIDDFQID